MKEYEYFPIALMAILMDILSSILSLHNHEAWVSCIYFEPCSPFLSPAPQILKFPERVRETDDFLQTGV